MPHSHFRPYVARGNSRVKWVFSWVFDVLSCPERLLSLLERFPFLDRELHLASAGAVVGADDAVFGHPVDHPRAAAVADAEGALQERDRAAAFADDDFDGLLVKGIAF